MNPFLQNGLFESREENEANAIFNNPLAGLIQAGRPAQSLAGLFRPGGLIGVVPAGRGLPQGIEVGTLPDERVNPMPGEPGHDPDPGFTRDGGLETAVTKPWHGRPATPVTKPWYDGPGSPALFPRQDSAEFPRIGGSGRPVTATHEIAAPPPEQGPAKASGFIDPKTGKLDYWAWLDAGAANLGKGGVLFEDDMPEAMESGAARPQQLGVVASGSPENKRMPDDETFEEKQANFGYGSQDLAMNMAAKARGQQPGADAPGAQPGQTQPPVQAGQAGQSQPPAQGGTGQAGPAQAGTSQTAPSAQLGQTPQGPSPVNPEEIPGMSVSPELWREMQEAIRRPKQHKVPNPSVPEDYIYPTAPDPKDPKIKELITSIANKHGVPPELMLLKAYHESGYNESLVSDVGAVGILQVLPSTAKQYGFDPRTLEGNIEAGTLYMKKLLTMANGNPVLAEAGYFGGDSVITGQKPFGPKTMDHVRKLLPGMDDELVKSRYPEGMMDPNKFWQYLYPYGRKR
jgi:hypothetical protein